MITIHDAVSILFKGVPSGSQTADKLKGDARTILRYFGVPSQDGAVKDGFGKAPKLYDEASVRRIAEIKLTNTF